MCVVIDDCCVMVMIDTTFAPFDHFALDAEREKKLI